MGSVHVTAHRLWKAVAFAAALWAIQSSPAAADDRLFADLNGDGRTDQVAIVSSPDRQAIRLTFSGGTVTWLRTPRHVQRLVAGDLNRDGQVDLVATTENLEIVAWLNRGHGRFTQPRLPARSHRAPPGPIVSGGHPAAADAYSIGSDPDSAIVRLPLLVATLVPRAALCYSDPIVSESSTTPSRPRGPPLV
ncbi:MAG TPA: VCBS repeat-containing protein [Vicinamibacterales bacterium]|jgi:hypothetical protein|nr:VCBS repeat-containing protein [Vicinamibacterales bacterium]